MKKSLLLVICAGVALTAGQAAAIDRGQMLADNCMSCHSGGANNATIPNLTQYPSSLIVSQMKAFKDGSRPATMMSRHAKGYSDADIAALAKYIGIQGQ
ncbi:MAG: c-type cytochrome [Gammaproteobacteria bacterium]|nr:c-type cytochrome [Gammaproteobacteria bacterium]